MAKKGSERSLKNDGKLRVAVIGCGETAERHITALSSVPQAEVVACCDTDERKVKELCRRYGIKNGHTDYMKMLRPRKSRHIDVIHVCLPSVVRAGIAGYGVLTRCHVLVEPPMAYDFFSAADMVSNIGFTGKRCSVLFPDRSNATTRYVRDLLDSGRLGKILSARTLICAPTPVKEGELNDCIYARIAVGHLIFNVASHAIDLVNSFVGVPYVQASCSLANRGHVGYAAADTAEGTITYKNGVKHNFYCTSNYDNAESTQIFLMCEHGEIVFNANDVEVRYHDGGKDGMHDDNPNGYFEEVSAFYRACLEGGDPLADAKKELALYEILQVLYKSAVRQGVFFEKKIDESEKPDLFAPQSLQKRPPVFWY